MKAKSCIIYALKGTVRKIILGIGVYHTRTAAFDSLSQLAPTNGISGKGKVNRDSRLRIMRQRGWKVVKARVVEI